MHAPAIRHRILVAGVGAPGLLMTLAVARARGGFDHEIFPDAPPQPRVRTARAVSAALVTRGAVAAVPYWCAWLAGWS